ncbi:MAG: ABC transporter, permease protein 1 (cluster 1, maltose/g3p/polyamine/iron), partial [uncultured Friedmanniella sp.]
HGRAARDRPRPRTPGLGHPEVERLLPARVHPAVRAAPGRRGRRVDVDLRPDPRLAQPRARGGRPGRPRPRVARGPGHGAVRRAGDRRLVDVRLRVPDPALGAAQRRHRPGGRRASRRRERGPAGAPRGPAADHAGVPHDHDADVARRVQRLRPHLRHDRRRSEQRLGGARHLRLQQCLRAEPDQLRYGARAGHLGHRDPLRGRSQQVATPPVVGGEERM